MCYSCGNDCLVLFLCKYLCMLFVRTEELRWVLRAAYDKLLSAACDYVATIVAETHTIDHCKPTLDLHTELCLFHTARVERKPHTCKVCNSPDAVFWLCILRRCRSWCIWCRGKAHIWKRPVHLCSWDAIPRVVAKEHACIYLVVCKLDHGTSCKAGIAPSCSWETSKQYTHHPFEFCEACCAIDQ